MIEVRAVSAADVPQVLALVADVLGEFGLDFGKGSPTDAELHGLPASYVDRGGAFWVALRAGELLGTCGVFPVAPLTFELRKMYLRGASRGLGLGRRLLDAAVAWSREQGARHIVLDTIEEMNRAIAFYEANGFVRDDSQKRAARCTRGYRRDL
jgi:GNAT superfamily N-acetyltransferase